MGLSVMEGDFVAGLLHETQDGVVAGLADPAFILDLLFDLGDELFDQFQHIILTVLSYFPLGSHHLLQPPDLP